MIDAMTRTRLAEGQNPFGRGHNTPLQLPGNYRALPSFSDVMARPLVAFPSDIRYLEIGRLKATSQIPEDRRRLGCHCGSLIAPSGHSSSYLSPFERIRNQHAH